MVSGESSVLIVFGEDAQGYWQSDDLYMRTLADVMLLATRFAPPSVPFGHIDGIPELRIGSGNVTIGFTHPQLADGLS